MAPSGIDPPRSRAGEQRAQDPAETGHGDKRAGDARAEADDPDQEDDEHGLVADQREVRQAAIDRAGSQQRIPRDDREALADLVPQVPAARRAGRLGHPDPGQADRGNRETGGVGQHAAYSPDRLGDHAGRAGAGHVRHLLAPLQLGVALEQVIRGQQGALRR
jgi:hypothetical protein